ncbi:RNA-binding protein YlmH [Kineothrix alysoides]|uniref:RNA-binding protein YlmH n=1 Tax=Kineothrix alysoides TaxID=1469948 RepID=A0A4R1QRA1_9FIRM|nr:YlmH/Sll1252 family protein [Kineothrix alysoides]TCL55957.1 RNA-binding protein YlmH [Kineothrix alysoides]
MYNDDKELQQLKKRIAELARKSYEHNIYTYIGFLSMAEQDVFYSMEQEIKGISYKVFGGSEDCERQMLRFGSAESLGYEEQFPIICLAVKPLIEKFADELSHRDFLGALMNLGIDRSTVGDIFLQGKNAYIFCTDKIAPFIIENLDKVKHTNVRCVVEDAAVCFPAKEPEMIKFTVSSERADAVSSRVYQMSRNQSLLLFREKRIYINGRVNENNSYLLKRGDIVSVRGYGRFIYYGCEYETKKGKLSVLAGIYK